MAVYKVPQDVEADDKLIGPFSFRQFIYLIIVAISGFIGYVLGQIFIGLAIIPLPIILLFGALALPLRKDQPMETYLVAVIRFVLKPRLRLWSPDGSISLVNITVPQTAEEHLTKDIGGSEAQQRLSYLAQIVDTGGWASKGVGVTQSAVLNLNDTIAAEATNAPDIMDDYAGVNQSFNSLIEKQDEARRQQLIGQMKQAAQAPPAAPQPSITPAEPPAHNQYHIPAQSYPQPEPVLDHDPFTGKNAPFHDEHPMGAESGGANVSYNPYPTSMHQKVISPHGPNTPHVTPHAPNTMTHPVSVPNTTPHQQGQGMAQSVSPGIMRLASNKDLSISAIAHEAHRLESNEVVVSLHDR